MASGRIRCDAHLARLDGDGEAIRNGERTLADTLQGHVCVRGAAKYFGDEALGTLAEERFAAVVKGYAKDGAGFADVRDVVDEMHASFDADMGPMKKALIDALVGEVDRLQTDGDLRRTVECAGMNDGRAVFAADLLETAMAKLADCVATEKKLRRRVAELNNKVAQLEKELKYEARVAHLR